MPYKEKLAELLTAHMQALFPGAVPVRVSATPDGLLCDFDLPHPVTPPAFDRLRRAMAAERLPCAFELADFSGAYRDGDAAQGMLQRIHVLAFESEAELEAHRARLQAAADRDHRALNARLGLYLSSEQIGRGLILWSPKGAALRASLERFAQSAHMLNGYQWVYSPHIGRARLWETSGHLGFYRDAMYSPIDVDGEPYYLKPMNCPFHVEIYNSGQHSYRDLPVRYAEFGTVYRYELSGALSGLTRVRGFTQDDAHIICTPEQAEEEVARALRFSLYVLRTFGLERFAAYVSTRPAEKYIGDDSEWEAATGVLKRAVSASGLACEIDEGGGAFYGPKIDLKLEDALGRQWQCSTIQFDFNLPRRFEMRYTGSDGARHTPLMLHRALFGSIERFLAMLTEHCAGAFPLWLAPVQAAIVPIGARHGEYAGEVRRQLSRLGFRIGLDGSERDLREKIRRFEQERVPYILVLGDRERASGQVSVRCRERGSLGAMTIADFAALTAEEAAMGTPEYLD